VQTIDSPRLTIVPIVGRDGRLRLQISTQDHSTSILSIRSVANNLSLCNQLSSPTDTLTVYCAGLVSNALAPFNVTLRGVYDPVVALASLTSWPDIEHRFANGTNLHTLPRLIGVTASDTDTMLWASADRIWRAAAEANLLDTILMDSEAACILGRMTNTGVAIAGEQVERRLLAGIDRLLQHKTPSQPGRLLPTRNEVSDAPELVHVATEVEVIQQIARYLSQEDTALVVHPHWHAYGSSTGRITSTNPNIQAIPRDLSSALIARPHHILISGDWAAQEVHILAALSQDESLRHMLQGRDPYAALARDVLGSASLREKAKTAFLAVCYGAGVERLKEIGIPGDRCASVINAIRRGYPRLLTPLSWPDVSLAPLAHTLDAQLAKAVLGHDQMALRSKWRRRLGDEQKLKRDAVNTLAQSAAAHVLRDAIIRLDQHLPAGSAIIMVRHDEIVVETPVDRVEAARYALTQAMSQAAVGMFGPLAPRPRVGTGATLLMAERAAKQQEFVPVRTPPTTMSQCLTL